MLNMYDERCNTDTTLTNLLTEREQKQKEKNKRLLNLRKYNVVSTLKETAPIYIYIQLPLQVKI